MEFNPNLCCSVFNPWLSFFEKTQRMNIEVDDLTSRKLGDNGNSIFMTMELR